MVVNGQDRDRLTRLEARVAKLEREKSRERAKDADVATRIDKLEKDRPPQGKPPDVDS